MNIKCPISTCGQENPADAVVCSACGTQLRAYSRLFLMSDYLFNEGLRLAQSGHFQQAEQTLQTATLFKSGDVEILVLLAEVQAMQGHLSAAAATLAHAEEKSAGNSDFQKVIDNLRAVLKKFTPISQPAPAPAKLPPKAPAEKQPQASNPVSKSKGHKHRKNKRR